MKIDGRPNLSLEITIVLNESEAHALLALAGYGHDAFIKHFYGYLGESYMKPHEGGLRSFLKAVRETSGIGGVLNRMNEARMVWDGRLLAVPPDSDRVKPNA